jgi:hypothetical protein
MRIGVRTPTEVEFGFSFAAPVCLRGPLPQLSIDALLQYRWWFWLFPVSVCRGQVPVWPGVSVSRTERESRFADGSRGMAKRAQPADLTVRRFQAQNRNVAITIIPK